MNAIQCHLCWGIAISTHVHHMAWCRCGSVAADGGPEYDRRAWKDGATYSEIKSLEELERARIVEQELGK